MFQWNGWGNFRYEESLVPGAAEYAHLNSIDIDFDGNLLLHGRRQSQILKVDRHTGEVLWRWGGPSNEFTFLNDPYFGFAGSHCVRRIPNGNVILFDNGSPIWPTDVGRPDITRVCEYRLDETNKIAELVWSYDQPGVFSGRALGSVRRLPNGNTLIGWGNNQDAGLLSTEVDRSGEKVHEMSARQNGGIINCYRVFKYPH